MSKQQYINNYNKKSYYSILLRIPKKNNEIMEQLESVPSKNGYVLNLIEEDINPTILKIGFIKKVSKPIFSKYGINKIFLFGSYARGDANKDSDVDILCDRGNVTTLIEKELLEEELEKSLGKKVDLIFTTSSMPEYFENSIKEDLIELC